MFDKIKYYQDKWHAEIEHYVEVKKDVEHLYSDVEHLYSDVEDMKLILEDMKQGMHGY